MLHIRVIFPLLMRKVQVVVILLGRGVVYLGRYSLPRDEFYDGGKHKMCGPRLSLLSGELRDSVPSFIKSRNFDCISVRLLLAIRCS